MLAARLHDAMDLRLEDVGKPEPPPGYVLVKTSLVGICGTDKALYTGRYKVRYPLIPGHEFVGRIAAGELEGHKVVGEINITCGRCWFCRNGIRTQCPYRKTVGIDFDGAMAEYLVLPEENIHVVDDLPDEVAVFTEPLAAVIQAFQMKPLPPGSTLAVLGTGTLSLLFLQLSKAYGMRTYLIYRKKSVRTKVAEEFADGVFSLDELQEAKKITPERQGFDAVVEATGSRDGLEIAVELARPRGVVYAKSTHGESTTFDYTKAVVKEVQIVTSRCGPFDKAISLLRMGRIDVKKLVTHVFTLNKAKQAFEKSLEGDSIKVLIRC